MSSPTPSLLERITDAVASPFYTRRRTQRTADQNTNNNSETNATGNDAPPADASAPANNSYQQLRLKNPEVSAFVTPFGQFEYTVVPFGLVNAPSAFSRFVHDTLEPVSDIARNYLDDIAVGSATPEAHAADLCRVLHHLHAAGLRLNARKCSFFAQQIKYLGHIISNGTIRADPSMLEAVKTAAKPHDIPSLRSFLGLTGWLRRFVRYYAEIATPLTNLLRGDQPWTADTWDQPADDAFDKLVTAITSAPALAVARPDEPYHMIVDWSTKAIGGILCQRDDSGQLQPVAFRSRRLLPREANYPPWEGEALAIVDNCSAWRCYIHNGKDLTIYSDHRSLQTLMMLPEPIPRQARWIIALSEFMPHILYKPGASAIMAAADCLSRPADDPSLALIEPDPSSSAHVDAASDTATPPPPEPEFENFSFATSAESSAGTKTFITS